MTTERRLEVIAILKEEASAAVEDGLTILPAALEEACDELARIGGVEAKVQSGQPISPDHDSALDRFHAHIEACHQCDSHPHEMCDRGLKLIKEASDAAWHAINGQ